MQVSLRLPGSDQVRVLGVGDDGRWAEPRPGADVDVGQGMFALPGLVDAHAHLAADRLDLAPGRGDDILHRAYACLDGGTFLVIDKGWSDGSVVATLSGQPPRDAPDFEAAGHIISVPGGYYPGFAVETDSAGLADVVAAAVTGGRGWVKLIGDWPRRGLGAVANFSADDFAAAVSVAHRGGARVAVHTMAPEVATLAVGAGVDSIEHGLFLGETDLVALADRGGAWVPTLLNMGAVAASLGAGSSGRRLLEAGIANATELLRTVPEGVFVLAGTDLVVPSGRVGEEVLALVEAGLPAARAVDAVSGAGRRYLGRPEGFAVGEPADAVFYPADPVDEPGVLLRPAAVMRHGALR